MEPEVNSKTAEPYYTIVVPSSLAYLPHPNCQWGPGLSTHSHVLHAHVGKAKVPDDKVDREVDTLHGTGWSNDSDA